VAQTHPQFVVQKHAARSLHYDFRLEMDGVLKSWAVPKGPCLDPGMKRLAIQVDDHAIEFGEFEGVIAEGEYGAGAMILWDRGSWECDGDPADGHSKGRLTFRLCGEKLRGKWTLVRLRHSATGREWLLIKEADEESRRVEEYDVVQQRPESVKSGRTIKDLGNDDAL
jgi:bifunctional non-homologous end joining protein LigD